MSRDVIVDDTVYVWDVQSSGRHVGRQQHRARLGLELVQRSEAFILIGERDASKQLIQMYGNQTDPSL